MKWVPSNGTQELKAADGEILKQKTQGTHLKFSASNCGDEKNAEEKERDIISLKGKEAPMLININQPSRLKVPSSKL